MVRMWAARDSRSHGLQRSPIRRSVLPALTGRHLWGRTFRGPTAPATRTPKSMTSISKVQGEASAEKRIALFKDFQKIVLTDLPTLPLVELKFFTVQAAI